MRGSPIRTPSDQRSVGSSPRLIAASHVLHRLLVPRHPPCALNNLTTHTPTNTHTPAHPHPAPSTGTTPSQERPGAGNTRESKMLASTVQFSTTNPRHPPGDPTSPHEPVRRSEIKKARNETTTPTPPATTTANAAATTNRHSHGHQPRPVRGRARSLRTQQRAYHHHPPHGPRSPPPASQGHERIPRTRTAVLEAGDDRRPNWSAFHPRALPRTRRDHPRLGGHHGPGTTLDQHTPPTGDALPARCSLERR